jgi:hypothetical protein
MCGVELGPLSGWATAAAIVIGAAVAGHQLQHGRRERREERLINIAERIAAHNASFGNDTLRRRAIAMLEGLHVPHTEPGSEQEQSPSAADRYWAMRFIHLGHINLVWHVWELLQEREKLDRVHYGWERFAREIILKPLQAAAQAAKSGSPSPEEAAGNDIWDGLHKYEVSSPNFVLWLEGLNASKRTAAVKLFTTIVVVIFAVIAIVHLIRLFECWEVTVAGFVIPVWWSGLGLVIAGGLALMVWRESRG